MGDHIKAATSSEDEFLASISHELRTPLVAILGQSEALLEQIYGPVTSKQIEALQLIASSGQHLLSLINTMLDLSEIESGHFIITSERIATHELCMASVRMVAPEAAKKQIKITLMLDSAIESIQGDPRRLKQMLVNLLSNAVKFTPAGGRVGLKVIADAERQIATFSVWDTGIGVDQEDLPHLFKPFGQIDRRLSRKYSGLGLGLALVSRLAEAHGGTIAVESILGQGSQFTVTLPWSSESRP